MVKFAINTAPLPRLDTLSDFDYKQSDSYVAFVEFQDFPGLIYIVSRRQAGGCYTRSIVKINFNNTEMLSINSDYSWNNFSHRKISKVYDASVVLS